MPIGCGHSMHEEPVEAMRVMSYHSNSLAVCILSQQQQQSEWVAVEDSISIQIQNVHGLCVDSS